MASGILIVDKPEDWTSQDVVAKLRGALHERRAGHGGTLDPMATGVLPVFFGRATRAVEFFEHAEKTYEAVLRLGLVTDTQDITGRVLEQRDASSVTEADVRAALPRFLGPQKQVPPMYSAIKIGGKKLYELARAGQEVTRPARDITIHTLELLSCAPPDFTLRVHCSKGTYVRTLCHDLGAALGTGGCMAALRRTAAGAYTAAQAVPLADILDAAEPGALICGGMLDPAEALLQARGISFYDYAKDEALLLQNAELTAEAALALLLERLPGPLAGSRILLCGFGRIGKLLARKLKALGADVTVSARKAQALELARILGYRRVTAGSWADAPAQYDGIVNTVPAPIIGPAQLPCIRRDCVLLELASLPGGFCAEAQALPGYCAARGLPGKYAPEAAAAIIRSAIFRNLNLEEAT